MYNFYLKIYNLTIIIGHIRPLDYSDNSDYSDYSDHSDYSAPSEHGTYSLPL